MSIVSTIKTCAKPQSTLVGVFIGAILGVLGFFGTQRFDWCCVQPKIVLTASSVRIDPANLSSCDLHDSTEVLSDGTKLDLVGTDLKISAVIKITYPDGRIYDLNGVGAQPVSIPGTSVRVKAISIGECDVRVILNPI